MSLIPVIPPVGNRYSIDNLTLLSRTNVGTIFQVSSRNSGWSVDGLRLYSTPNIWADAVTPWDSTSLGSFLSRGGSYPAGSFAGGGVGYNTDGTKIYVALEDTLSDGVTVNEYNLSTAFDPDTNGSLVASATVAGANSNDGNVQSAWFSSDGTRLIWSFNGASNALRFYYAEMSTPFSVASLGAGSLFETFSYDDALATKGQGDTTFFVIDERSGSSQTIYEYLISATGNPGTPSLRSSVNLASDGGGNEVAAYYGRFGERFFALENDGGDAYVREYQVG